MRIFALLLLCVACAGHIRRVREEAADAKALAVLLMGLEPVAAWQTLGPHTPLRPARAGYNRALVTQRSLAAQRHAAVLADEGEVLEKPRGEEISKDGEGDEEGEVLEKPPSGDISKDGKQDEEGEVPKAEVLEKPRKTSTFSLFSFLEKAGNKDISKDEKRDEEVEVPEKPRSKGTSKDDKRDDKREVPTVYGKGPLKKYPPGKGPMNQEEGDLVTGILAIPFVLAPVLFVPALLYLAQASSDEMFLDVLNQFYPKNVRRREREKQAAAELAAKEEAKEAARAAKAKAEAEKAAKAAAEGVRAAS
mmetsp:Transcript_52013/g.97576  ORF Transcript_52013/g.97576 Transcript_52013/m.97576 type:complete len:306 (+) Transcript_52013:70-987(+)